MVVDPVPKLIDRALTVRAVLEQPQFSKDSKQTPMSPFRAIVKKAAAC
jgi:hypothetical protein